MSMCLCLCVCVCLPREHDTQLIQDSFHSYFSIGCDMFYAWSFAFTHTHTYMHFLSCGVMSTRHSLFIVDGYLSLIWLITLANMVVVARRATKTIKWRRVVTHQCAVITIATCTITSQVARWVRFDLGSSFLHFWGRIESQSLR